MCKLSDGMAIDMTLEEMLYEIVETHDVDTSQRDASSPCHSPLSAYVLSAVHIPCEPRREPE
ncbi:MAG: hypothetical protein K6G32_13150 [Prevotella sp.]|nr:hypothetical protein [Prevotella sp.]